MTLNRSLWIVLICHVGKNCLNTGLSPAQQKNLADAMKNKYEEIKNEGNDYLILQIFEC